MCLLRADDCNPLDPEVEEEVEVEVAVSSPIQMILPFFSLPAVS